jgi:hypothetical protein
MEGDGRTACRECGQEYSDSLPACPKCGEPYRLNSLAARPVEDGGGGETGRVTRLGRPGRSFHRTVSIRLRIPPILVVGVFFLVLAAGIFVLRVIWGLLGGK